MATLTIFVTLSELKTLATTVKNAATDAHKLLQKLKTAWKTAKTSNQVICANADLCKSILDRVLLLEGPIHKYVETGGEIVSATAQRLTEPFNKLKDIVDSCICPDEIKTSKLKFIKWFMKNQSRREQLSEDLNAIEKEINNRLQDFHLGIALDTNETIHDDENFQKLGTDMTQLIVDNASEFKDALAEFQKDMVSNVAEQSSDIKKIMAMLQSINLSSTSSHDPTSAAGLGLSWEISHAHLTTERELGQGAFGTVYLGSYNHAPVAIKELMLSSLSSSAKKAFFDEVAIMSSIRHPNIVTLYGATSTPPYRMVMEYIDRGALFDLLGDPKVSIPLPLRYKLILDAAIAISVLHTHHPVIIHRDIKSLNCLIDRTWNLKMSDFGLSKAKSENSLMSNVTSKADGGTSAGTLSWMAPELLKGKKATMAADIYSFGILVYEIMTRKVPWIGTPPAMVGTFVLSGKRPLWPGEKRPSSDSDDSDEDEEETEDNLIEPVAIPATLISFVKTCLAQKKKNRPDINQCIRFFKRFVAKHPYDLFGGQSSTVATVEPGKGSTTKQKASSAGASAPTSTSSNKDAPHPADELPAGEAQRFWKKATQYTSSKLDIKFSVFRSVFQRCYAKKYGKWDNNQWNFILKSLDEDEDGTINVFELESFLQAYGVFPDCFNKLALKAKSQSLPAKAPVTPVKAPVTPVKAPAKAPIAPRSNPTLASPINYGFCYLVGAEGCLGKIDLKTLNKHGCVKNTKPFAGCSKTLRSIAFSSDFSKIFIGTFDSSLLVAQTTDGTTFSTRKAHTFAKDINVVKCSSNGKWLACGSDDNIIYIFDQDTTTLQFTLVGHTARIRSLAFSKDSSFLFSGSKDGTIRRWDLYSKSSYTIASDLPTVFAMVSSAQKDNLFVGTAKGIVLMYSGILSNSVVEKYRVTLAGGDINSIDLHPTELNLSCINDGRTLSIMSTITLKVRRSATVFSSGYGWGCQYSPDGRYVVCTGSAKKVSIVDVYGAKILKELAATGTFYDCCFDSYSERWYLSASSTRPSTKTKTTTTPSTNRVYAEVPQVSHSYTVTKDGYIVKCNGTGSTIKTAKLCDSTARQIDYSPTCSTSVFVVSFSNELFEVTCGSLTKDLIFKGSSDLNCVAVKYPYVFVGDDSSNVTMIHATKRSQIDKFSHTARLRGLHVLKDILISFSENGEIKLSKISATGMEPYTTQKVYSFSTKQFYASALSSIDIFYCGGGDGKLTSYSISNKIRKLKRCSMKTGFGDVNGCFTSPSGKMVVAVCDKGIALFTSDLTMLDYKLTSTLGWGGCFLSREKFIVYQKDLIKVCIVKKGKIVFDNTNVVSLGTLYHGVCPKPSQISPDSLSGGI